MTQSRRFALLAERESDEATFVDPWPEAGLIVADSPFDPAPSLRIEDGRVAELDGRARADFDLLDRFIADHSIDLETATEAMALPAGEIARMLVDIYVPREQLRRIVGGCTPSKLVEII